MIYLSGNGLAAINGQCMEPITRRALATNDAQWRRDRSALLQ
jgi:hypothetical protein